MKPPKICHHDNPSPLTILDAGDAIRQRAAESCGFQQGQHLEGARAELQRNGGAEGVLDAVVRKIERGDR